MSKDKTESESCKQTMAPQNGIDFNPCIVSPFAMAPPQRKYSRENIPTKKNLQQWLRLQEIYKRMKYCEDEDDKMEIFISKFYLFLRFLGTYLKWTIL